MRMRYGTHALLEAEADRLLKASMAGITKHSSKADILTPWKEADRKRREIYVPSGTPDPAHRQGMFHRALNRDRPHLNGRDGFRMPASRDISGSLKTFVDENGCLPDDYEEA